MVRREWVAAVVVAFGTAAGTASASAQARDLTRLSLEDLLGTEVTSASRKAETLLRTASAIYVITQEDIRRSGARTIPDVLRMAPGVAVAQIDGTSWAIGTRGFNGLYSDKLLVLIDGRSVYSPMFGGVHWEMQNVPLTDIDRIEVIRGPGGTLWGVNAVNGVINIITKPADATQGGLVAGGFGTHRRAATDVRYGGRTGAGAYYRVFGRYAAGAPGRPLLGFDRPDASGVSLGGARIDWSGDVDRVSIHGLVQDGRGDHVRPEAMPVAPWGRFEARTIAFSDGNVNVSWTRSRSSRSERGLQAYYQRYVRANGPSQQRWHVVDMEARQRLVLGRRHEVVAGLGYRVSSSAVVNSPDLAFLPAERTAAVFSGFVQDEITLGAVSVVPGVKVERNAFTGIDAQPSLRANWLPAPGHSVWGAVTRAVRTPSQLDRGFQLLAGARPGPGGVPVMVTIEGNPGYRTERVGAVEGGYRWQRQTASVDVTVFGNHYDDLRGLQAGAMRLGSYQDRAVRFLPLMFANILGGRAYGAEASVNWQPLPWWKVSGSYAWTHMHLRNEADPSSAPGNTSPDRQVHVRSYWDLPGDLEASALFYGVAGVSGRAEAYRKVDVRFAWRASRRFELAVTGQNLLHDGDVEFAEAAPVSTAVRGAVFGELAWRF